MNANNLIANMNVFYSKMNNLHFNVTGYGYPVIHTFLETAMIEIHKYEGNVTEQMILENLNPEISLQAYLNNSTIEESENKKFTPMDVMKELTKELDILLNNIIELKKESSDLMNNQLDELHLYLLKLNVFLYNMSI